MLLRHIKAWGHVILCQKYGDTKLTVSGNVFEICISDLVF